MQRSKSLKHQPRTCFWTKTGKWVWKHYMKLWIAKIEN